MSPAGAARPRHPGRMPINPQRAGSSEGRILRGPDPQRAGSSECIVAALTGADPDDLVDRRHPHLAVTDLAGGGGLDDRVDHASGVQFAHHDLDPHLRYEVHLVLRPAVDLGVAALATEALDLAHREPRDADEFERVLDVVQLERLDDRGDQLHTPAPSVLRASARACPTSDAPPPATAPPPAPREVRSY